MKYTARTIVSMGMLIALSYILAVVGRVPLIGFLKYDPKDVIIVFGGMLFGPWAAVIISVVVSFMEFMTVSSTGIIGLFMNIVASTAFALPPVWLYRKEEGSWRSVCVGAFLGIVSMSVLMLLWNYILTPLYLDIPREAVIQLLLPMILPFNLIKGGANAIFVCVLYKPIVKTLLKLLR